MLWCLSEIWLLSPKLMKYSNMILHIPNRRKFWQRWSQVKCPFGILYYWWVLMDLFIIHSKNICHCNFFRCQNTVRSELNSPIKSFRNCLTVGLSQIITFSAQCFLQRVWKDKQFWHIDLRRQALMMSCVINWSRALKGKLFM